MTKSIDNVIIINLELIIFFKELTITMTLYELPYKGLKWNK